MAVHGKNIYLGPNKLRELITVLRAPVPLETADVEDAIFELCGGKEIEESSPLPFILPVVFEKWYKDRFQEYMDETPIKQDVLSSNK